MSIIFIVSLLHSKVFVHKRRGKNFLTLFETKEMRLYVQLMRRVERTLVKKPQKYVKASC